MELKLKLLKVPTDQNETKQIIQNLGFEKPLFILVCFIKYIKNELQIIMLNHFLTLYRTRVEKITRKMFSLK